MNRLIQILLVAAFSITFACKNKVFNEKEKITINKAIVEYFYPEAEYIFGTSDTLELTSFDTNFIALEYGGQLNVNIKNINFSVKHIGGWIDTMFPPYDNAMLYHWYDPDMYLIDTMYDTLHKPISYLVYMFEDKKHSNTVIDTAVLWKNRELKFNQIYEPAIKHHTSSGNYRMLPNLPGYFEVLIATVNFVSNQSLNSKTFWLENLEKIPLQNAEIEIYFFDLYPFWEKPLTSSNIIF